MSPRWPIVGMMALLLPLSGCLSPSHGVLGYYLFASPWENPEAFIRWNDTDPATAPPEIPAVFEDMGRSPHGDSGSVRLSKERQEAVLAFCQAEWARQTGQEPPANGTFPILNGTRFYAVGFATVTA